MLILMWCTLYMEITSKVGESITRVHPWTLGDFEDRNRGKL